MVSLFAQQGLGYEDFINWYQSEDNSKLVSWQRRIAASDVILLANQSVDYWLAQAEQLVITLPEQLQTVVQGLVNSVKQKSAIKYQGQIA